MSAASTQKPRPLRSSESEERRALLQRVLVSAAFSKTERLSSFLSYICELTLSGRASELNEQKIGTAVFGRPQDYDSTADGIVRPQATRLRQRLDEYFSGEGAQEPVRITLPRGSYVPLFESQMKRQDTDLTAPSSKSIASDAQPPAPNPATAPRPYVGSIGWAIAAGALLLLLASYRGRPFAGLSPASAASHPPHPLWSVLFPAGQRTMVVPSDTGLVMWGTAANQSVNLNGYLSGRFLAESTGDQAIGQLTQSELARRRYTSIVDLQIVKSLTHIADAQDNNLNVQYARDLRPGALKDGNIVLIGAPAANPWVSLFEPNMIFAFTDAQTRKYTILNRAPLKGEPAEWTSNLNESQRVYGVVAFMPNLDGNGHVLILEGTSTPGTECAWDFVSDDSTILAFLRSIKPEEKGIPHFQVVVECSNLTGSSVERRVLARRIMK